MYFLDQLDGNEYRKQTISGQQERIKSLQKANFLLSTATITNEKRIVSKGYIELRRPSYPLRSFIYFFEII
jgi:hypothetical protein